MAKFSNPFNVNYKLTIGNKIFEVCSAHNRNIIKFEIGRRAARVKEDLRQLHFESRARHANKIYEEGPD